MMSAQDERDYYPPFVIGPTMDYNVLKLAVLELFRGGKELDSSEVLAFLTKKTRIAGRDKAVEMALLRYWRQGLLSRKRRKRRFYYIITEKGIARLEWLLKTMPAPSVA